MKYNIHEKMFKEKMDEISQKVKKGTKSCKIKRKNENINIRENWINGIWELSIKLK